MVPDTEELVHFRERWKEEIRGRERKEEQQSSSYPKADQTAQASSAHRSRNSAALEVYNLAVTEERNGNQSEANRLYLSAFRLDPHVDTIYHGDEHRPPQSPFISSPSLSFTVSTPAAERIKPVGPSQSVPIASTLPSLLESWTHPLLFTPENEAIGVPINRLPDELIIFILYKFAVNMDANSIERFAMVSRRARMLSLDNSVWRQMAHSTFVPAQLSDRTITLKQLAERYYCSDYRRVFIEHPRLRFDGVYISVCPYVRFGLSENPWITMSHLITYRRFLRFFPSGEVLAYRANEDQEIKDVIRTFLQPGQHQKDLLLGSWQLTGTTVLIKDLSTTDMTPSGHSASSSRYQFQMTLTLGSRPMLGKWNKLDLKLYESIHPSTGTVAIPLLHERPYWFSKVKSYQ